MEYFFFNHLSGEFLELSILAHTDLDFGFVLTNNLFRALLEVS